MENKGIDKGRVSLGAMICLVSYFIICLIIKAFGLDLFEITSNIAWANNASAYIFSNLYLCSLVQAILLCINLFFVLSISGNRYDAKRMVLITIMLLPPMFGLNILFNMYRLPTFIMTVILPYFISLCLMKEKTWKSLLFTTIRYIIFSGFIILVEMGLMYLKITLLKFNYHAGNIFNVVLLNLDLFVIYFSTYFLLKYTKIREWTCNLCKKICGKIFKKKQKKED